MARDFNDFIASLPQEEQEAIEAEAKRLLNEEMTLRELRKAREYSQQLIADILHVNQAAVSKLEHRADMYISTLRSFVQATGGNLELIATYPDRPPIKIKQFEDIEEPGDVESESSGAIGVVVSSEDLAHSIENYDVLILSGDEIELEEGTYVAVRDLNTGQLKAVKIEGVPLKDKFLHGQR